MVQCCTSKCAKSFACSFEITEFKGSSGWLNQFQGKYGINHKVISGTEDDAPKDVTELWKGQLKEIIKQYLA
jgi:hypothetical protein